MSKGFSLIEILVVVGLIGLIGILSFSGLNNSINFNLKSQEKSDHLNNLIKFNEILKRDLFQTINRLNRDPRGNRLEHSFYGNNPGLEGSFLSFTVINRSKIEGIGSIRYIEYVFEENNIKRVEYSHGDLSEDTNLIEDTLLRNIESLDLVFGKNLDWFIEWPNTPWTDNNGLPESLRLSIQIKDIGLIERNYLVAF